MRIVADEGVDRQIIDRLRRDGHDVIYIAELDPGIDDEAVLQDARDAEALLITADKDFGELVFRREQVTRGVVLLRLGGLDPYRKAEIVASCLEDHGPRMLGGFTVISRNNLRIRRRGTGLGSD